MKTTLIGTALIAALLAGAASAGSSEFGVRQTPTPAAMDKFATSDANPQAGDKVQIAGTNMYYIHDATNATGDAAAPLTTAERLARVMN